MLLPLPCLWGNAAQQHATKCAEATAASGFHDMLNGGSSSAISLNVFQVVAEGAYHSQEGIKLHEFLLSAGAACGHSHSFSVILDVTGHVTLPAQPSSLCVRTVVSRCRVDVQ